MNDEKAPDTAPSQVWGGRFHRAPAEEAVRFGASVDVDQRLARFDIAGSRAHVSMLGAQGILSQGDTAKILEGLEALESARKARTLTWDDALEDVHMNLEMHLTARIGEAGRRLHTARSRNDQVATDTRLWTRAASDAVCDALIALCRACIDRAEQELDTLLPAYTHLQRAQPVRLAHHLLAWVGPWLRDAERLLDGRARINVSPLGAGALATTTFPIDREATATALAFDGVLENSLDAVSARDYLMAFLSDLAIIGVHLSRVSEELVLWSSQEFGFVTMDDAFSTGSSMMPQKKNPDMAELIRGKAGGLIGHLVALMTTVKGLPLTYNRDLQEDKKPLFDSFDAVHASLVVMRGMVETMRFNGERMRGALSDGYLEATDVADYLAARGVPFRDAHACSGRLVALASEKGVPLPKLSLTQFKSVHDAFEHDIFDVLEPEHMVERRRALGGPARSQVTAALQRAREATQALTARLDALPGREQKAELP